MKVTLTLSRWHKVAERIDTALKEREAKVKTAFTATTIPPRNKDGVEEKAADITQRAADDLALVEAGARAVAAIRAALALRNAELGIPGKLAEVEGANRRAALYKAVIDGRSPDMVRPEGVCTLPAERVGESESRGLARRTALAVSLQAADRLLVEVLRERLAREQRSATRLLDEVADLNREKLEIDLPQEVIGIAALGA